MINYEHQGYISSITDKLFHHVTQSHFRVNEHYSGKTGIDTFVFINKNEALYFKRFFKKIAGFKMSNRTNSYGQYFIEISEV